MDHRPIKTMQVATKARSRHLSATLVANVGGSLLLASIAALVLGVVSAHFLGRDFGLIVIAAAMIVAIIVAILQTLRHQRPLIESVAAVDRALNLKDRLSSALDLSRSASAVDPAFVVLAVRDAETAASNVRVSDALSVRFGNAWVLWPMLSLTAVAAVLYVPLAASRMHHDMEQVLSSQTRLAIAEAARAIEGSREPDAPIDEADEQVLARLRDIEAELSAGRRAPDQAAIESAAALEERAQALEAEARRADPSPLAEMLAEDLRDVAPDELGRAGKLGEALRDADFAAAQEALRELIENARALPDLERELMAEDLRKLAEALDRDAPNPPDPAFARPDQTPSDQESRDEQSPIPQDEQSQPRDAPQESESPPSEPDDAPSTPPNDGIRESSPGSTEPPAEQRPPASREPSSPADQALDQQERERQSAHDRRDEAREAARDLSRNLRDVAEQIRQNEMPKEMPESEQQNQPQEQQAQPEQQPDGANPPEGQSTEQQQQQQQQGDPSTEKPTREQSNQSSSDQAPPAKDPSQQTRQDTEAAREPEPTDSTDTPQTGEGHEQSDRQPSPDAVDRALDQLQNMSHQQREAMRKASQSQSLRDKAQELLSRASPEQRERIADLARQLARDSAPDEIAESLPWAPSTTPVDARDRRASSDSGRNIGDVAPTLPPGEFPASDPGTLAGQVRDAAASAERAIEGQAIPRRYRDFVRSVYRRYEDRTHRSIVAPDGRDADAPASPPRSD